MKYTKEEYETALAIYQNEYQTSGVTFKYFIENTIAKLSKPKPKMYRCIKEIQGYIWETGAEVTEHAKVYGISPPELPFHFELITEPVKEEPITWEGLIDIMLKCNWGTYSSTAEAIVKRIKSDHNL